MKIVFKSIKLHATKSGKCLCGKRLTRSETFEQTINPFNKNKLGEIKSTDEIWEELKVEADKWKKQPVRHNTDSYWHWAKEQREQYEKGQAIRLEMTCGFYLEMKKENLL